MRTYFDYVMYLKVVTQTSRMQMLPTSSSLQTWETYHEDSSMSVDGSTLTSVGLLEQINVTRDTSDYLWYSTRYINRILSTSTFLV